MKSEFLLSLNLILPLIAALAVFIRSQIIAQWLITIIGILLVLNNGLILLNNDNATLVLASFLGDYKLELTSEPFAIIFSLMVTILYFMNNLYSFAYLDAQDCSTIGRDLNPKLHFFFTPIAIMASLNIGYSSNLITLFVFYEILTLSTYPLVIQSFSEAAGKAGKYYLAMLFGSSSFFLLIALVFIDSRYGLRSFKLGGGGLETAEVKDILLLLICFVFGFSKTAIFPLYKWLPKAMVAPIPVSALLHAVAVVKSGIFALIKVFLYFFSIGKLSEISLSSPEVINWLTWLASFTILFAGISACMQSNLKKILAYSTISQLSYMMLSLSLVSYPSVIAAFLHMLSHSIAKITLFFSAGIIYIALHKVDIKEMRGVAKVMPIPVMLFIMASLSIIGLPFSVGYITIDKIYEIIDFKAISGSIVILSLLISKVLSCFYFMKVIFIMLMPALEKQEIYYKPKSLNIIASVTFALSIVLLLYISDVESYLFKALL